MSGRGKPVLSQNLAGFFGERVAEFDPIARSEDFRAPGHFDFGQHVIATFYIHRERQELLNGENDLDLLERIPLRHVRGRRGRL
jgi:hypothetical protein